MMRVPIFVVSRFECRNEQEKNRRSGRLVILVRVESLIESSTESHR